MTKRVHPGLVLQRMPRRNFVSARLRGAGQEGWNMASEQRTEPVEG
ncbi:MAG: hypothetical protein K2J60_01700 [Acetatifactor sp.]|nr:hypothetical protein [Acetatifactor sp.]